MTATAEPFTGVTETATKPSPRTGLIARWRAMPIAQRYLALLLVAFVVKQSFLVVVSPPFTGHDEVAHYSYVRMLVDEHRMPKIVDLQEFRAAVAAGQQIPGDYIDDDLYRYCRYVLDWYCDLNSGQWLENPPHIVTVLGTYYPSGWQYAANHPPGYYLLMAPIYWASEGVSPAAQQYLLRAAAIPFGVLIVALAYLLATTLFPGDRFLALTVPTFVAFQPQVSYEAAMVNNDIAGVAVISLVLYLLARGIRREFTWRLSIALGVTLGLGLLIKGTTTLALPAVAFGVAFGAGLTRVRTWLPRGVAIAAIAGAISSPWYAYLHRTYGDFSGLNWIAANQWAHTYQGRTPPTMLDQLFNSHFAWMRWRESWGEFGWRLIPLGRPLLVAILVPVAVGIAGLLWYVARLLVSHYGRGTRPAAPIWHPERSQVAGIAMLGVTVVVAYAGVLQFGTRFSLTQARYFFPAVNAFAVLLMLGFRAIVPSPALRYAQGAILASLVLLNVIIYTVYVIPFWHLAL